MFDLRDTDYEALELKALARLAAKPEPCQCDGEQFGPCPGPRACIFSGMMPEEGDDEEK